MSSDTVPPLIAAQINYLRNHFPLPLMIENMWSGSRHYPGIIDRFTLVIPYCLEFVKWDIMYDAESPFSAPDIMFGPEDENFHPFTSKVDEGEGYHDSLQNSLRDWNSKDPSRLTSLLQELRDRYASYQRKRVEGVEDERLKFELCTMLSREGIEMHLSSGVEKPEEVKFAVPLVDININKMIPGCPWRHPQKIFLQVLYPVVRKYASTPAAPRLKLVSTSELKALLSIEDIKLPSWIDGMCMAEYLPHLEESLEKQVLEAVSLINVRRGFIEALDSFFGRPLEADPVFCRTATVIAASGVFTFLVHFLMSTQFPKKQPSLVLQSSQHFNSQGAPIKSQLITDYPWSPRWEPLQMAERIFEFLADEALSFKRYCNEAQLQ
ncbi:BRISC and BRCA1-A complex member 2-like isoform X1 [Cucurbita pepo subsp. pepo]|uniref:BRISC and BRCA1-A complex member 2-like isoform X1 n=2 Tax=Cucurbita pepo subsp. pepo TaxID=3664 RepID=UPI000C9D52EC|nr:BRISC and BRCA1-A complex member 2-like isoform X1 [Cucurbita pepo subsp. pepo]